MIQFITANIIKMDIVLHSCFDYKFETILIMLIYTSEHTLWFKVTCFKLTWVNELVIMHGRVFYYISHSYTCHELNLYTP